MTNISNHKDRIKEHTEELQDVVNIGIYSRPATIGFHTTACSIDLLEMYLHKKKLIDIGKVVKHDWFKRPIKEQKILPLIERKLPVNFDDKEYIYELIYSLEENRDILIYGKPTKDQINNVLKNFQKIKKILVEKLEEEGEHIE